MVARFSPMSRVKPSRDEPRGGTSVTRSPLLLRIRARLKSWSAGSETADGAPVPFALHDARAKAEADRACDIYANGHLESATPRILPWPFKFFITLNSDCDSTDMEGLLNTSRIVREHYGLPIADSFFPKWLYLRGVRAARARARDGNERAGDYLGDFAKQNFDWLQAYFNGAADTVHGWIPRMRIKIAGDFSLGAEPTFGQWLDGRLGQPGKGIIATGLQRLLQLPLSRWRRRKRIRFTVPPSWHRREPPRYLYFEASLPFTGRWFVIHVKSSDGASCSVSSASLSAGMLLPNAYVVDLLEVLNTDPRNLNDLEIEFELKGPRIGKLRVRNPTLLSDTRSDIESHMRCMRAFNALVTTYTSHGGGYDIGRKDSPSVAACDPRIIAELRDNPHYALDLFKSSGMEFFNTASNTSKNEIQRIDRLVYPNVLNNGEMVYDFTRFLSSFPRDLELHGDAGEPPILDPSYSEAAGRQIRAALDRMREPGDGALIYTHLLVKGSNNETRGDRSVENLLNRDTHDALSELAAGYYGLEDGSEDSGRTWVAPASVLLRYSQVRQGIHGHVFYDPECNAIHINPWYDYVLDRVVPDLEHGIRELRGLTFYVSSSHEARLLVGGRDFDDVIRNPADETGRESITVADTETPMTLLGRTSRRNGDTGEFVGVRQDESSVPNGVELVLEAERGELRVRPGNRSLAHQQYVSLRFRKTSPDLRVRIDLECDDGLVLGFGERGFSDTDGGYLLPPWTSSDIRTVILPFHSLLSCLQECERSPPTGRIETVRIRFDGPRGERLVIDHLRLLRDNDCPRRGGCVLGGRIETRADVVSVRIACEGREHRLTPFGDGTFVVPRKLALGEVCEITGITDSGDEVAPVTGRFVEMLGDTLEVRF